MGEAIILLTLLFAAFRFFFGYYSTLLEGFSGQSIGKRVIGLKW
jgi:hypothetical protein